MDIIVVRQPDDSFKISPFRIRFGSFRILKAKEKIVNILVNGLKCDLTMRLSEFGEAYFMNEIHKVVENSGYLSDCYSPVESGKSAPASPFKPKNITLENKKILVIEKLNLEDNTLISHNSLNSINLEINTGKDSSNIISTQYENENTINFDNNNKFDCQNLAANMEFLMDRSEIEEKRMRKMSFDVLSRDENFYKFRMSRQNSFSIQSSIKSKSNMKIELSNSWNLISKSKENLEDIFTNNKISRDEFFKDPWKIINSGNLAIRYEDYVYTWKVIAPIIISQLAYNENLPTEVISSLTQQQQGFFLWRKVNMDAFKIDIKKKLFENDKLEGSPIDNKFKNNNKFNFPKEKEPTPSTEASPSVKISIKQVETKRQSIQYKKTYTLSTDQIKSLNLNKGKNEISFVVSSKYQGTHVLTSDIYLWDWEDKIVISDLDGTITRSDVLGHILPFIGKDWSHKGVVKLFNDIYNNGYKIIYLTARSISQADQTKNYLKNKLSQNKIKLPTGPLLMSPDGLVSSFKREIIDRIPQSFKIECLTQIVNLFPAEARPFYAGYGNRHTDAISYEAVGVSRNKIFIINEKGEITQYNYLYKTTYLHINENVNEMFPQVNGNNTYFSSLNYFKPTYSSMDIKSLLNL